MFGTAILGGHGVCGGRVWPVAVRQPPVLRRPPVPTRWMVEVGGAVCAGVELQLPEPGGAISTARILSRRARDSRANVAPTSL